MTPAINLLVAKKIEHRVHAYEHDSKALSYGLEAAAKLGVAAERVFKTLVLQLDKKSLAVGLVAVDRQLNLKQLARACNAKRAEMATQALVQRSTGYVLGGVSPLGQKKLLPTVIDLAARECETVFVSAGKRGLEIEMAPQKLLELLDADYAGIAE